MGSPVFIAVLIRNGPISAGQFRGQHLQRRAAGGIFFTFFVGARWGTFSKTTPGGFREASASGFRAVVFLSFIGSSRPLSAVVGKLDSAMIANKCGAVYVGG